MSMSDVRGVIDKLLHTAEVQGSAGDVRFNLVAQSSPLTDDLFIDDPLCLGDPSQEVMCWVSQPPSGSWARSLIGRQRRQALLKTYLACVWQVLCAES